MSGTRPQPREIHRLRGQFCKTWSFLLNSVQIYVYSNKCAPSFGVLKYAKKGHVRLPIYFGLSSGFHSTFALDKDALDTDTLHMDASADNPPFNLPPEMIVGLFRALNNSGDPVVREFHDLLRLHPVSRASVAGSISPDPSTELCDPSPEGPLSSAAVVSSSSTVVRDASGANGVGIAGNAFSGCCRNGRKRTTIDAPRRRPALIAAGEVEEAERVVDERMVGQRGVTIVDESEFSASDDNSDDSAESESESESSGRKRKRSGKKGSKKKRSKKDPPPQWLIDGSPPELHAGTDSLLIELCRVVSNDGLQSLTDLVQNLIRPGACEPVADYSLDLGSIITACSQEEKKQMVVDFRHMMLLIRLAFHLER